MKVVDLGVIGLLHSKTDSYLGTDMFFSKVISRNMLNNCDVKWEEPLDLHAIGQLYCWLLFGECESTGLTSEHFDSPDYFLLMT